MSARHSNGGRDLRPAGWLIALLALIVLTTVGIVVIRWPASESPDGSDVGAPRNSATASLHGVSPVAEPDASGSAVPVAAFITDQPAAELGAAPCTAVRVVASRENQDMVRALARSYTQQPRSIRGHCVRVTVAATPSGDAETAVRSGFAGVPVADRPTIWLPDSSAWLELTRQAGGPGVKLLPEATTGIAQSGIVVAMPAPLATAIGWTTNAPTWSQVFAAARDRDVWTSHGHTDWGTFKLGKTSPMTATSGLMALSASYLAASGDTGLTVDGLESADDRVAVTRDELATSHYMSTPQHFLWHAREAEQSGSIASFLSAMIVDENTVWDYNRGLSSTNGMDEVMTKPPRERLVPIYPSDGVFVADNPAAILSAPWVSAAQRAAAADFVRYAGTAQGQTVVRANGYRDLHGRADAEVEQVGSLAGGLHTLALPSAATLAAVQRSFPDVRKRARVLFLIDMSGSMNDTIAPGVTKLQAAQKAVADALKYFEPGDEVGLAAFTNSRDKPLRPGLVSPVTPLTSHPSAFLTSLHGLQAGAETPLYDAIDTFATAMQSHYDPDKVNAVIVLSDGRNDTTQTETKAQLLRMLGHGHEMMMGGDMHAPPPVLVFTLAYGHDADVKTLTAIATASGGHFYDATNPLTIDALLSDLVTSF